MNSRPPAILPFLLAVLPTFAAGAASAPASRPADRSSTVYLDLRAEGGRVTSFRPDGSGSGRYGSELVAPAGSLRGFSSFDAEGNRVVLRGVTEQLAWDLPFERAGYYDSDAHLNYPSPLTMEGAVQLHLPVRRFVTSAGQYVNIEHFKRLPVGHRQALNTAAGNMLRLELDGDRGRCIDLLVPGAETMYCVVGEHALTLEARPSPGSDPVIHVADLHRVSGAESSDVPGGSMVLPAVRFEPEFEITCRATGKRVAASDLATDLLRMAVYWHPDMTVVGDWGLGAVETHMMDDPRSWYLARLRAELLRHIGWIGYDRFEHFGLMFAWGRLPDYGAGGLLNLPPGNAPYDMRMLHLNGQWIETIARYVLATGDVALLRSKRVRWVATDGDEPQPLCGRRASLPDYVLAAGDVRLDGRKPRRVHTLSQRFRASRPFTKVLMRLGTDSRAEAARAWVRVQHEDGRVLVEQAKLTVDPAVARQPIVITLPVPAAPGTYRIEIGDEDSGARYFGPGLYWLTDPDSHEDVPPGGSGPFAGDLYGRLVLLFDYIRQYAGAAGTDLFRYINDPEFNIPDHKSGRPRVCTENSYWEAAGGGYDAFEGLWYNAACRAMAELAALMGEHPPGAESGSVSNTESIHPRPSMHNDPNDPAAYRDLAERADRAYNAKYWHEARDNGRQFHRYIACEDWDGRRHDYGYAYYNLEAVCRGIASPDQARDVLHWLDHGQWSPDEGRTWHDDIYAVWEMAAPFNTIGNDTWLNVTGNLPYGQVLANGGTRPAVAARDLLARSRYAGIDSVHARNLHILSRFARPDRLTGGRTFDDPGGRGRWHFGEPHVNRADIEGFREIFPQNGDMATYQVMAYLGLEYTAAGLRLRPRVPTSLTALEFTGIGYRGRLFDFRVERVDSPSATNAAANQSPAPRARLIVRDRPTPGRFALEVNGVRFRPDAFGRLEANLVETDRVTLACSDAP